MPAASLEKPSDCSQLEHPLRRRLQLVGVVGQHGDELGGCHDEQQPEHREDRVPHGDDDRRGQPARPPAPLERPAHGMRDDHDHGRDRHGHEDLACEPDADEHDDRGGHGDEHPGAAGEPRGLPDRVRASCRRSWSEAPDALADHDDADHEQQHRHDRRVVLHEPAAQGLERRRPSASMRRGRRSPGSPRSSRR